MKIKYKSPQLTKNDMKQTAVEWLQFQIDNKDMGEIPMWIYDFCQQAKEMEKEQISNAYVYGSAYGIDLENGLSPNNYYNETFNK
jgi:hypothetical protein